VTDVFWIAGTKKEKRKEKKRKERKEKKRKEKQWMTNASRTVREQIRQVWGMVTLKLTREGVMQHMTKVLALPPRAGIKMQVRGLPRNGIYPGYIPLQEAAPTITDTSPGTGTGTDRSTGKSTGVQVQEQIEVQVKAQMCRYKCRYKSRYSATRTKWNSDTVEQ